MDISRRLLLITIIYLVMDQKCFFKGDVAYGLEKRKIKKVFFLLLEVLKAYVIILIKSIINRPVLINYLHAGNSFFFVSWFLNYLR